MKTYLDCYPCFLRQTLNAPRRAKASEDQQRRILLSTMEALAALPADTTPPQMALYPMLKEQLNYVADPLETAVRMAIAGNIIDLGVAESYDLEENLQRVLRQDRAINDLEALRIAAAENRSILYLADNAGETVFDRLLIETLGLPVTYAAKSSPIINDATRDDAIAAGIDRIAEVIDNGSNAPGMLLDQCSEALGPDQGIRNPGKLTVR